MNRCFSEKATFVKQTKEAQVRGKAVLPVGSKHDLLSIHQHVLGAQAAGQPPKGQRQPRPSQRPRSQILQRDALLVTHFRITGDPEQTLGCQSCTDCSCNCADTPYATFSGKTRRRVDPKGRDKQRRVVFLLLKLTHQMTGSGGRIHE